MPIETSISDDENEMTISVAGNFSFDAQKDFRASYENRALPRYVIDFKRTEFIDSSALGMLLMMREHVGASGASIVLRNCNQDIKVILTVANFQDLFNIE
ncbi:MAG TPA: STAS domain-containing protein [Gammaproteobacteria bacterium]